MDKGFEELRGRSEAFYRSIGSVHCPYLQSDVHFNAQGLEHLKFKKKNHARSTQDQFVRLKLLKFAPEIIKLSRTVQGISDRKIFVFNRSNHRNEHVLTEARFFEFIAVFSGIRAKVIVRKIGNAPAHFWSVIPYWKQDTIAQKRKLYDGNPEED